MNCTMTMLDDRTLRLSAVREARRVQHLMRDPRSHAALDVAERHANGQATDAELAAARAAAWDAESAAWTAWTAARDAEKAAWTAARDARKAAQSAAWAAVAAAWSAAWSAAEDAARAAAVAAAWSAAWSAAEDAARAAARDAQADWLRENAKPCFDVGKPRDGHTVG